MLTGSSGADWFIVNQFDKITDFNAQKKDGDLVTWV
jgi:Ca2+-binding RTX toxin-like protein